MIYPCNSPSFSLSSSSSSLSKLINRVQTVNETMELKINHSLLIVSCFSLIIFFNYAESACVPRHSGSKKAASSSPSQAEKANPPTPSLRQPWSSAQPPKSKSPPPPPPASSSSSSASSMYSTMSMDDNTEGLTVDGGIAGKAIPGMGTKKVKPSLDSQMSQVQSTMGDVCKQTDYPALCLSTITPFYAGKNDRISMAYAAIKACTQYAQQALAMAQKMSSAPTTNSLVAARLSDCADDYQDALDNLDAANQALSIPDFSRANSMLSAVVTDASDCSDSFPGNSSPMLSYETQLQQMGLNCLSFTNANPI